MKYVRLLLCLLLVGTFHARLAKAGDADGKMSIVVQLGDSKDQKTGNHFLFMGGGYYNPFSSKTSSLRHFSFGAEFGRSVLSSQMTQDPNLGPLRDQNRLWFFAPMARYNALATEHFRVTLYGGGSLLRRTEVLQAPNGYGGWTNIGQYGYGCATCQSSTRFEPGGGISVAWAKHKDSAFSIPVRYMYYRSGVSTITAGFQITF